MTAPHKVVEYSRSYFGQRDDEPVAEYETFASEELAEAKASELNDVHGSATSYWAVAELDDDEAAEWLEAQEQQS